jgi:hypothetical protein
MGGFQSLIPVYTFFTLTRIVETKQSVVFRDWANVSFQDQQDHFWSFFGLVIGLSAAAAILT